LGSLALHDPRAGRPDRHRDPRWRRARHEAAALPGGRRRGNGDGRRRRRALEPVRRAVSEVAARPTTAGLGSLAHAIGTEAWDYYARLRERGDMVWDEQLGAWLVTSRELVREVGLAEDVTWQSPFVPDEERGNFGMDVNDWIAFQGPSPRSLS